MISHHNKLKVTQILDAVLSAGSPTTKDNRAYFCPFCHHHKKKLEINLESEKWHCWTCDAKGTKIKSLLRKLHVDSKNLKVIDDIYGDDYVFKTEDEVEIELRLPTEFVSLAIKDTTFNPLYKRVMYYLQKRGITECDIIRYNMGYCRTGRYAGRVIIPSYDENGKLNYFIARTVFEDEPHSYKNPPVSKNVIALANQINWNEPITICEGIFDAMSIKRNAIPIFGKFISKKLMAFIFKMGVTEINIMLDADAQKEALYYTNYFSSQGIRTKNVIPTDKDAGEMGFNKVTDMIRETKPTSYTDIITQKLKLL